MSRDEQAPLVAASRWMAALALLFALTFLANWPPSVGAGFAAGLGVATPFALNALLVGVPAALVAVPSWILRAAFAAALAVAFLGAGLPNFRWDTWVIEGGAFVATAAGLSLALLAVMGRVAMLRESN